MTIGDITTSTKAIKERIRALVAVSLLSDVIRGPGVWGIPSSIIPTSQTIPFEEYLSLPPPFSRTTPKELLLSQVPGMTSTAFFEDGEWIGVYSMSFLGTFPPSFDPPMRGIYFKSAPHSEHHSGLSLKASGRDRVGEFSVEGVFSPETLQFRATKIYSQGPRWPWSCVLLPCGLVGTWGSGRWGGWLWLWKASWQ